MCVYVQQKIQYLKCSVFIVVLLPMDNIFCMYFLISYEYCSKQTSYGNRQVLLSESCVFFDK